MKKGTTGSKRKKYAKRRTIMKVLSGILLVLLVLAFIGIRMRDKAGTVGAAGPEQTQESASLAGTAENFADGSSGINPDFPEQIPADSEENEQTQGSAGLFTLDMVPAYSGRAYADINGDVPFFAQEEMTAEPFHEYWPLDDLGRCTGAYACVGPETLPTQKRGDISSVRPTGWNTNRYSDIDGEMLFNRCHMIGHMLTGQDANERNLITGTRYMNVEGMLPFEESVVMYVEGTGHHVMYRVRPFFEGDNLVCTGVLMEARSVEDPLVQFCAFCYNVQPGFEIDYATGDNRRADEGGDEVQRIIADPDTGEEAGSRQSGSGDTAASSEEEQCTYILNTNTHKFHMPYCDSVQDIKDKNKQKTTMKREELIEQGYSPCKRCNP